MFKKPEQEPPGHGAQEAARVKTRLSRVLVQSLNPFNVTVFTGGKQLFGEQIESVHLSLNFPESNREEPELRGILTLKQQAEAGSPQYLDLLPGTVELQHNLSLVRISCPSIQPFQGCWVDFGMNEQGQGSLLEGARGLQILLTEGILGSRITWNDGRTEEIFGTGHPVPRGGDTLLN